MAMGGRDAYRLEVRDSVAEARSRSDRKMLVFLVVLIAVLFMLDRCGDDANVPAESGGLELAPLGEFSPLPGSESTEDPDPGSDPDPDPGSDPDPNPDPDPDSDPDPDPDGKLTAGGTSLFPLSESAAADGSLTEYVGQPAVATGVTVLSVPADEGFWVGTSDSDRVWVQLIGTGESPYTVRPGDTVLFNGEVVAHGADFPSNVCVGRNNGSELLAAQGAHIEVPMDDLILRKE